MHTSHALPQLLAGVIVMLSSTSLSAAGKLLIKKGDRIAIAGDSITESRIYTRYIEDYIMVCAPELSATVRQFGVGGEKAAEFLERIDSDVLPYNPDMVVIHYGMNDGEYHAYEAATGTAYKTATRRILRDLKDHGVRALVGSPGAVDPRKWLGGDAQAATVYNETLAQLSDLARMASKRENVRFADVHDAMLDAMKRVEADPVSYIYVAGEDGVHPSAAGHVVIAYAFLKSMGFDGNIGRVTIDMNGKAKASEGHKVVASEAGEATLLSTRYPFCFYEDKMSPAPPYSILPYVMFNQDLNRFILRVKNLKAGKAVVNWGGLTREFTRKQLETGVNLAAEFFQKNPFSEPFNMVDRYVAVKQDFEYHALKLRWLQGHLGSEQNLNNAMALIRDRVQVRHDAMQAEIRTLVHPVLHTIRVTPQ